MFNVFPSLPFTVLKIYIWVSYIYHLYSAIFHLVALQLMLFPIGHDKFDRWQNWRDLMKLSAHMDVEFLIHTENWACKWPTYLRWWAQVTMKISYGSGWKDYSFDHGRQMCIIPVSVRSDQENCHCPLRLHTVLDMTEQAHRRDMSLLIAFKTFIRLHWSYPFIAPKLIYMHLITGLSLTVFSHWILC